MHLEIFSMFPERHGKRKMERRARSVDSGVDGKLGSLDQAEDDSILLPDEGLPDVGQRQHVIHNAAAVVLQGLQLWGRGGRPCGLYSNKQ